MKWIDPPGSRPPPWMPDLNPLIVQALERRGIKTQASAEAFLNPDAYRPTSAWTLSGVGEAVARITTALRVGEPICVWGDFDVDGQTATAVLVSTLRACRGNVSYHVPARATEGHGIRLPQLREVVDGGARLILTCDTGIGAHEAAQYTRSRGVDMVITDHHDLEETLPEVAAVINPKMLPGEHPLSALAGVGVAYKLGEAILSGCGDVDFDPESLLDLVALGLIGDLALLRGDTRYLVQRGLAKLRCTGRVGLRSILELAGLSPESLNEDHVGFELAPRLNALGRLGNAGPAVELLTTSDRVRAGVLAVQLESFNAQRRLLSQQVYRAAEAQLSERPELLAQPIIILANSKWHGGVIGIVAGRLAQRYGKPTILFHTDEDGLARGSARSIEGLHITRAIAAQRELLHSFGGHPMAAGLSLDSGKIEAFRKGMSRTVEQMLAESRVEEATLRLDGWLGLPQLTLDLAESIERLSPFGPGNGKLILATRSLELTSRAMVGRTQEHLKLTVQDESGVSQQVMWWNGAGEVPPEGRFDLAYTLRASDFRGARELSLELVDFRVIEPVRLIPARQKPEVLDLRKAERPQERLRELQASGSTLEVWAEAEHRQNMDGLGRQELIPAHTLVIWTVPPSPDVLREAVARAQPSRIILVGTDPGMDDPKAFLERLGGLVKFSINQRQGLTSWIELAAATSQREAVARLGVEWLASRGQVQVESAPGGGVCLREVTHEPDEKAAGELMAQVQASLYETSAYRAYFIRAENPVE